MDKDCECLDKAGCIGRYGVLFKLTLVGYDYTFVFKGVQAPHRYILEREAAVYRALMTLSASSQEQPLQGRLVPVF